MLSFYARCSARVPRSCWSINPRHFTHIKRNVASIPKTPASLAAPKSVTPESARAYKIQRLAASMLDSGRNELYRNTAVRDYIVASYGIMAACYIGCAAVYTSRYWDRKKVKQQSLPWWVAQANQAVMIVWGVTAAYAFARTMGLVRSVSIVKDGNKILLKTLVRRSIPFMKPETVFSEPHTLLINRSRLFGHTFNGYMISAPTNKIWRTLFYKPFSQTRKVLGGVGTAPMKVGVSDSQRYLLLDIDGQFSNGGEDILAIAEDDLTAL